MRKRDPVGQPELLSYAESPQFSRESTESLVYSGGSEKSRKSLMIRSRRISRMTLQRWLVEQPRPAGNGFYHLRLWREELGRRCDVLTELVAYFQEALEDARLRLRSGFEDALSPFNDPVLDPAANYPGLLHRNTLKGYLGETFAALAVEHWDIHNRNDWQVPALLFRFHDVEFQHLERINQQLRAGQAYDPDARAPAGLDARGMMRLPS